MRWTKRVTDWLERRWATPAFAGWVLIGLTACFWMAAANTLAGWLYVLSGTLLALLALSMWLPMRSLRGLTLTRQSLYGVSVGETLSLSLQITNEQAQGRSLLQCRDQIPPSFEQVPWQTIDWIGPKQSLTLNYGAVPQQRGLFRWQTVDLRTAAPLGLFWCRRSRPVPAHTIIYPKFIPLSYCPLLDEFAAQDTTVSQQQNFAQLGSEGTTRSVRPYRRGDAMRLIHWRSSARFNELRTRELEVLTGDSPVILALDSGSIWPTDLFESAIVAATSLYHYAAHRGLSIQLWTPGAGIQQDQQSILETLALVGSGEPIHYDLPNQSVLWLSQSLVSLAQLPIGSRSILWQDSTALQTNSSDSLQNSPDLIVAEPQDLEQVLQTYLR